MGYWLPEMNILWTGVVIKGKFYLLVLFHPHFFASNSNQTIAYQQQDWTRAAPDQPSHVYPVWIEPQFSNRSEWHAFPIVCFVFAVFIQMQDTEMNITQSSSDNVFVPHAFHRNLHESEQILYNLACLLAAIVTAAEKALNLTVSIANKSEYKWANGMEEVENSSESCFRIQFCFCMYWNRTVSMAPGLVVAQKRATVATIILCMYNMNWLRIVW